MDTLDIRKLGLDTYRQWVGAVMQDDQLFAGSIADNISFFDPAANQAQSEAAARLAVIHDDIMAMRMAYQSLVGEMGSSLSGGQKQRVILGRALYRQPQLLVLDEPTSHLDVKCELEVTRQVYELAVTRIVIAHRPETITSTQRVLQVANGAATFRHPSYANGGGGIAKAGAVLRPRQPWRHKTHTLPRDEMTAVTGTIRRIGVANERSTAQLADDPNNRWYPCTGRHGCVIHRWNNITMDSYYRMSRGVMENYFCTNVEWETRPKPGRPSGLWYKIGVTRNEKPDAQ